MRYIEAPQLYELQEGEKAVFLAGESPEHQTGKES